MKTKRKLLSLTICALLTAGLASYPMFSYSADSTKKSDDEDSSKKSDDDSSKKSDDEDKSKKSDDDSSNKSDASDGDDRGSSDKSKQKITICHVPPGNPSNSHTIHIAFSAWAAHKLHTNSNTQGFPLADYLGSCNNPPVTPTTTTTTSSETLHVISGCTGTYRDELITKVHSYFEPVTVADTSLDDEDVVTAMSQCLDKGDSSDSGDKGNDHSKSVTGGKGRGHDSVSDSGHHHRIKGCQNKDTHRADSSKRTVSDSDKDDTNKNFHKKLKDYDAHHDDTKGIKDPIVVSDSSLSDSGVWKEFKECAKDARDSKKIDSSKTGKKKGDSGHKHRVLKSCTDASGDKLRKAIDDYKAKTSTGDIILNETSYNDVSIKQAVTDCVTSGKGGGTDTPTTPGTPLIVPPSSSTGVSGRLNYREDTTPIKN